MAVVGAVVHSKIEPRLDICQQLNSSSTYTGESLPAWRSGFENGHCLTKRRRTAGDTEPAKITGLLKAWRAGDSAAGDELIPLVYQELPRIAARSRRLRRPGHRENG
jgi:ECF sigma factor